MEVFSYFVALLLGLLLTAYVVFKYFYTYWQRKGFKYLQPSFPFGNLRKSFLQKVNQGQEYRELYSKTTGPYIGIYGLCRPILLARDPAFIRSILISDFQHFVDRGVHYDEKRDPLSAHLFSIEGEKWRNLRVKLSPTFTSGKIKAMFKTIVDSSDSLLNVIARTANSDDHHIEIKELTVRFATNVIASVAFGLDANCIENADAPFRKYGQKFFDATLLNGFRFVSMFSFPWLLRWFRIRLIDRDVEQFMTDVVEQTLDMREKQNVVRKDFFQLLVQLRNSGTVRLDDEWETVISNDETKQLTLKEMTAQAYVFFIAGFETTSSTMSFCLYETSKQPEVQRKIQEEIDTVLAKYNGEMTYEAVNEMKYLDACIDETLRMYPVAPLLSRMCTKEYKIPSTGQIIEKGTVIQVPVYGLHHDPKYYPDPSKFDPTRFLSTTKKSFNEMPYLPFGEGPRNCIGIRLGKMQSKLGVATMLHKFSFEVSKQHHDVNRDLELYASTFVLAPVDGIHLKVTAR